MSANNVVWVMKYGRLYHVFYSGCFDNTPTESERLEKEYRERIYNEYEKVGKKLELIDIVNDPPNVIQKVLKKSIESEKLKNEKSIQNMLISKSKKSNTSTNSKSLKELYCKLIELKDGNWFILNQKDIDEIFENIMEYTGAYNKKTNKFIDGNNWSDLSHKMMDIFWKWYINLINKKLDITEYWKKYYKISEKKK